MIAPMVSSPETLRAVPAAAPLADVLPHAWIVGGAVRDLLLGGAPADLDLVVEGDAVAAARRLAETLGGSLTVHDRFGTATVTAGGHVYDLATARAETYARAGRAARRAPRDARGGPRCGATSRSTRSPSRSTAGSRRRRTRSRISTRGGCACCTTRASSTTRRGCCGSCATRRGWGSRSSRGPTRSPRAALDGGALATVTPTRIGAELRLLLREASAAAALAWIAGWPLGIELALDRSLDERALALLPADGREDLLLLGAAALTVPPGALAAWLDALGFTARERDTVVAVARARGIEERLAAAGRPSEIAAAARGVPVEAVALAGALGAEAPARAWLADLRHVRLDIDGADLLAVGIPQGEAVGRALAAALEARLDGHAPDREAQLAVARAAAAGTA